MATVINRESNKPPGLSQEIYYFLCVPVFTTSYSLQPPNGPKKEPEQQQIMRIKITINMQLSKPKNGLTNPSGILISPFTVSILYIL